MITKYDTYIKENNDIDIYFLQTYEETENWLNTMNIKKYTINDDLKVDINDDVNISSKKLTKIPIKFNKVNFSFNCNDNKLISLKGCPTILNDSFFCSYNNLTSLKYCPTTINGSFSCYFNNLTSLKYCPTIIDDRFVCYNNPNLVDINDLDSKILIRSINDINVKEEVFDKYFEYWIEKDFNILKVLKDKVSDRIKQKYDYLFNATNFDLI